MGNGRLRRAVVAVVVGSMVVGLVVALLSAAAVTAGAAPEPAGVRAEDTSPAPLPSPSLDPRLVQQEGEKPVTKTPQGQATQVTDEEHIGGLIAFIAFMLGGVLLLVRDRRRQRRERREEDGTRILS